MKLESLVSEDNSLPRLQCFLTDSYWWESLDPILNAKITIEMIPKVCLIVGICIIIPLALGCLHLHIPQTPTMFVTVTYLISTRALIIHSIKLLRVWRHKSEPEKYAVKLEDRVAMVRWIPLAGVRNVSTLCDVNGPFCNIYNKQKPQKRMNNDLLSLSETYLNLWIHKILCFLDSHKNCKFHKSSFQ